MWCVWACSEMLKSHSYPSHCKAKLCSCHLQRARDLTLPLLPTPSLCCFSFLHFPNSSLSYLGKSLMFENGSGGGASLVVQGLRLYTPNAGGPGMIPG